LILAKEVSDSKSFSIPPAELVVLWAEAHKKPNSSRRQIRLFPWRRHPDSNWGIKVLQTFALPLGNGATSLYRPETAENN
jgi:hypothetical protein